MYRNFFFVLFASVAMFSCSKEPKSSVIGALPNHNSQEQTSGSFRNQEVAEGLVGAQLSLTEFFCIAQDVKSAVAEGHDERVYLSDVLTGGNLRMAKDGMLGKLFNAMKSNLLRNADSGELLRKLDQENLSIYWPYVSSWDEKTMPVVAYVEEGTPDNALEIPGYELDESGKTVKKIMVKEEDIEKRPVIIVDKHRKSLVPVLNPGGTKLPDFDKKEAHLDLLPIQGETLETMYLGTLQATKSFEGWFKGGPEFVFVIIYPHYENGKLSENTSYRRIELTLRDVKNKVEKVYNDPIITEWQRGINQAKVLVYEDDTIGTGTIEVGFTISYKGVTAKFDVKIPETHTLLYKNDFSYHFLRSTGNYDRINKTWVKHGIEGLQWTHPIKTSGRITPIINL